MAQHEDDQNEQRVREHAYRLWEEEGRPEGQAAAHWEKARELAAIEQNQSTTTRPRPAGTRAKRSQPVEPLEALENQGDFPGLADQGEESRPPKRRARQKP
ncbi:MAG: DUF2934 domain-containing protein [Alphaproteobacteria bacterium]|nr:DUF2934 domain-containing protein [Alphaproteobacteria bacterium]MBU0797332.1 DUF2934 domain-containing protein [Alphaproteobacteria bacterium]MBU0886900.1 DUF2934 domain-containing protein [Alphaproteobacteria bacterium]MBU1812357.1 DUF2934 domain-containing protein [Alphaproteobacteria bacterium]MBU2090493.1 DUF2934 domain-containing protein [Alphaproteobacteria bacterium]